MTKLGFYNFYDIYNNNRMFDPEIQAPIGDDLLYPFHYLAQVARQQGISISTIDTESLDSYDAIIFFDYPGNHNQYLKKLIDIKFENLYLFLFENEIIRPENWKTENHRLFKKVFTWNDTLVDGNHTLKFFLPNRIPENISFDISLKKKFCCMISGNKVLSHPLELYSERVRAVQWFEKHNPNYFDLYGIGWDNPFPVLPSRVSRLFKPMFDLFPQKYSSYRGIVTSKNAILKQYKFSICYENARDIPGYITEKIFDSFFSGCIPVYWGAPNITDYIPEETFIDRRKFNSYEELYDYMINMNDQMYSGYIHSIEKFVNSTEVLLFSAKKFSDTILQLVSDQKGR